MLYLFPYYQTRDDYARVTGSEPPAFDPAKPPKYWCDPAAAQTPRRSVVYEQVLVLSSGSMPVAGQDGKPVLEPLVLNKLEAATVNIPPKGIGFSNIPGADVPEVPAPLRNLEPFEELEFGFGGTVHVRNNNVPVQQNGFSESDRALLQMIAKKLGV